MERLWAPWRAGYVQKANPPAMPGGESCFICEALAGDDDRNNLLVWRLPHSAVFLNRYPYNNGHLLVVPLKHRANLQDFEAEDLNGPLATISRLVTILDVMLRPQGYNVGLNLGRAAGAGLPGHMHWHLVPRWDGDTNFMPVLGETKVLIESLHEFYDRLAGEL
jgi:ATP adenylyltransferase